MFTYPPGLDVLKKSSSWEETYSRQPPLNVEIETDGECNRSCNYCPVAHNARRKGRMELTFFENIMVQLVDIGFSGHLGFHFYNEPLLDKRLEKFIRLARKYLKKAILYVITNGDDLDKKRIVSLDEAGLDYIRVSIHDKKTEKKIPNVLAELDKSLSDKIIVYNYFKGERIMTTRAGMIDINLAKYSVVSVKGGCIWSTRLVIRYDGLVPLCCDDFHGKHAHGDLKTQSLKEIWDSSINRRKKIFNGDFELDLCMNCLKNSPP